MAGARASFPEESADGEGVLPDDARLSEFDINAACTLAYAQNLRDILALDDDDVDMLVSTVVSELEGDGPLPATPAALYSRVRDVLTPDVFSVEDDDLADFAQALHKQLVACVESQRDAGDDLEPGECEMCDRRMPLTRHHLIPRSQHKEYRRLGHTQRHLEQVALVCRQCHSALHDALDEATLASTYNTVEKLLEHETVRKFCAWASKQKGRNPKDVFLKVRK